MFVNMEKSQKKEFKKTLNAEINKTIKIIEKYIQLCKPISPENAIGRVSRMDAINNKSVVEAALLQSKKKLKQLRVIEKKISIDNYGKCAKCNNNIPFQRLIIRPESIFCVNCAK